jgi:hypothetical protein
MQQLDSGSIGYDDHYEDRTGQITVHPGITRVGSHGDKESYLDLSHTSNAHVAARFPGSQHQGLSNQNACAKIIGSNTE